MAEFGEQLRKKREEKGMTQQSLADLVFVTRQTVSRWEGGERYPDLLMVKKLAKILEVDISYLLSDDHSEKMIERNPVIEKTSVNSVTLVLFAGIVVSYVVMMIGLLIRMPFLAENLSLGELCIVNGSNLASELISIIAFTLGFVWILKDSFSPKKVGGVLLAFFVSTLMKELAIFLMNIDAPNQIIAILPALLSASGGIASYFCFCKKKNSVVFSYLLLVIAILGIMKSIYTVVTMMAFASSYVSVETALKAVLSICIYMLICFQTSVLMRKRKNVKLV